MEIIEGLEPMLQTFWFIAIPTSVIFLIQTVLTFFGADMLETDTDIHGDSFQLFSLRNLINFLLGFSWTGISFYSIIENKILLVLCSLIVGILFLYLFFIIIKQIVKLAEDNSFKISETINKTAEVYITIPEKKSGKGKIMISIKGSFHELEAMTEHEKITTNTMVKVVKIENDNILIVETV